MVKNNNRSITRRGFIKGLAVAGAVIAAPTYIPSAALGKDGAVAASERITVGFIGTGSHGVGVNLQSYLRLKDSQAVALCDVDKPRMVNADNLVKRSYGKGFKGCFLTGELSGETTVRGKGRKRGTSGRGEKDAYVAGYSKDGELQVVEFLGGADHDLSYAIGAAEDGTVVISGAFRNATKMGEVELKSRKGNDIFVTKLKAN